MTEKEISELFIRLAFQYESALDALLAKRLIDMNLATAAKEKFYDSLNEEFDDKACEELIHQGHTTSITITPSLWIRRTHAVGMHVKQGKDGGVSAYPEIAADFHLWLDPKMRLALVQKESDHIFRSENRIV